MFWWLMTPFIGRNLDEGAEAVSRLQTKTTDLVIERCAKLAHDNETLALRRLYENMKCDFRNGVYGSSLRDEIQIMTLKQTVETQASIIEQLEAQLKGATEL